jgi:hypothetical protein
MGPPNKGLQRTVPHGEPTRLGGEGEAGHGWEGRPWSDSSGTAPARSGH